MSPVLLYIRSIKIIAAALYYECDMRLRTRTRIDLTRSRYCCITAVILLLLLVLGADTLQCLLYVDVSHKNKTYTHTQGMWYPTPPPSARVRAGDRQQDSSSASVAAFRTKSRRIKGDATGPRPHTSEQYVLVLVFELHTYHIYSSGLCESRTNSQVVQHVRYEYCCRVHRSTVPQQYG